MSSSTDAHSPLYPTGSAGREPPRWPFCHDGQVSAASPLTLGPPSGLRPVAPPDAPYAGMMRAGQTPEYWVPVAEFRTQAWQLPPHSHVLAPDDLACLDQWRAVSLPVCLQTLDEALARRTSIDAGECVTVVVSLLRGAIDAAPLDEPCGRWWLTEDARPVLALGSDPRPWVDDACQALALLAERTDLRSATVCERAAAAIRASDFSPANVAALEEDAFALAAPQPFAVLSVQPQYARQVAVPASPVTPSPHRLGVVGGIAERMLDADLVRRIGAAWDDLRRRVSERRAPVASESEPGPPSTSRRRMVVVAAAVAAVVVAAGVMWPHGDSVSAESVPRGSASPRVSPEASRAPSPRAAVDPDTALINRLSACAAQGASAGCRRGLWEEPTASFPAGVATAAGVSRSVRELDNYGGVRVVRITPAAKGGVSQIVVLVGAKEKWLVRDIYDIADQP